MTTIRYSNIYVCCGKLTSTPDHDGRFMELTKKTIEKNGETVYITLCLCNGCHLHVDRSVAFYLYVTYVGRTYSHNIIMNQMWTVYKARETRKILRNMLSQKGTCVSIEVTNKIINIANCFLESMLEEIEEVSYLL